MDEERQKRTKELAKKTHLILTAANGKNVRFYTAEGSTEPDRTSSGEFREGRNYDLSQEPVIQLSRLYASLSDSDKMKMVGICGFGIKRGQWLANYSPQLFVFLARCFRYDKALDTLLAELAADEKGWYDMHALADFLAHDHWRVSTSDLENTIPKLLNRWKEIENPEYRHTLLTSPTPDAVAAARVRNTVNGVVKAVQGILRIRVLHELAEYEHQDIKEDKNKTVELLTRFGLPLKLTETLEGIEKEYRKAQSDFDFNTTVKHSRAYFEQLLASVAEKIATTRGEKKNPKWHEPGGAGEVRRYLKNVNFLDGRVADLYEAFFQFASEEGTHRLDSPKEVARIVRNMNIELSIFILGRLDKFLAPKK